MGPPFPGVSAYSLARFSRIPSHQIGVPLVDRTPAQVPPSVVDVIRFFAKSKVGGVSSSRAPRPSSNGPSPVQDHFFLVSSPGPSRPGTVSEPSVPKPPVLLLQAHHLFFRGICHVKRKLPSEWSLFSSQHVPMPSAITRRGSLGSPRSSNQTKFQPVGRSSLYMALLPFRASEMFWRAV